MQFKPLLYLLMRLRNILLATATVLLTLTCDKKGDEPVEPEVKPEIKVPAESQAIFNNGITFGSGSQSSSSSSGQAQSTAVKFTATEAWSANVADTKASSWLSVQPTGGGAGSVTMTVTAQPNTTDKARSATVTIQCGTVKQSFTVNQDAAASQTVVAVESITLNKSELTLEPGASETLTAVVLPNDATNPTVTWTTTNPEIAIVEEGMVSAISEGEAIISAKAGEIEASCKVTVKKDAVPVKSVSLDRTSVSLEEGQTTKLVATISPNNADEKTVTWTTSDATIATVANGVVTAVAEGNATITASAGGKTATCAVFVKKKVVAVASVKLSKTTLALKKGQSETLTATVSPSDATDKTVTWSSSDATIADVTQDGRVTAMKSGNATITAKAGEKSATCSVTITTPVESVTLNSSSLSLEEGQTTTLVATINPNDADENSIQWTTSSPSVAKVTKGVVTAVAEGNATITASAGGKSATCSIAVKKSIVAVTSVTLNKTTLVLTKGQGATLTATVNPSDATDKAVTWSSSDATIASVSQDGRITALKSGRATITAKAGEKSATCEVSITTPVESVTLNSASISLEEGQTTTLVATVSPNDADEKTITWSSSNTKSATVTNGVIMAVAEGSATITASAGGKSATCVVTVKKKIVAVTSVKLNKTSLNLAKGQGEILTVTVSPSDATDKTVTWSSSDATVATVTQDGRVTAMKSGSATVTAKAGEKSATCEVSITTPVESVTLNSASISLEEGQTTTLVATINPNDADEKTVKWSTSSASVATVSNGIVTAVAEGNATITASVGGKSATCAISVKKKVIAVTSVTLNKSTLSLTKGQSQTLTATVSPSDATDKTVTWSSSDATVATVTQDGRVTAMKSGSATVTAKAGEKSATCEVSITTPVESVTLNSASISLEEGQTTTLVATINPNDADEKTVKWSTSSASVATVSNGIVTAVAEGNATITASVGGKSATCAISVKKKVIAVTSVTLNKSTLSLTKGQSQTLTATVSPSDATDKTVTWSSSDATVASVTQDGRVTALKSGSATIKAKAGEKSATCEVSITTPVESVTLNSSSISLEEGQTTTLVATINPNDADEKTVKWTTSSASVATVSNGVVTAVAEGTATITASVGGKSATCAISVKKKVIAVTSVTLNKSTLSLTKGQNETLSATVTPDNATDKTVTWSSSDATIVSVTQDGRITAMKSGSATITAKAGEKSATCEVSITTPVESVTLNSSSISLEEDQTTTLVATINPNDADEKTVKWTTSSASVAMVSNGVVTAVAEGSATITASAGGKEASCTVTVQKKVVAVTSVTLNKTTLPLTKGQSETLTATVQPDDATDKTVTWSSSDATIASVTQDGHVTAMKSGSATITAKAGEKSATCEVSITTPVECVTLNSSTISLEEGQTATLVATINPNDADEKTVAWSTSNAQVATVSNGFVSAVKEGTATITASAGGHSAACTVTVQKGVIPVTSVTLSETSISLNKYQDVYLTATVNPTDATYDGLSWSSSNPSVASVGYDGHVTAYMGGTATITATAGGISASCVVTVVAPVERIVFSGGQSYLDVNKGDVVSLQAIVSPEDATDKTITWSSSNTNIITIDQLSNSEVRINAIGGGMAIARAEAGGFSVECTFNVSVPVDSLVLNKSTLHLIPGGSERLIATVYPSDATNQTIAWSWDTYYLTVDQTGLVTANNVQGDTYVTASIIGGPSVMCHVIIKKKEADVNDPEGFGNGEEHQW